jgi:hypothetical protein
MKLEEVATPRPGDFCLLCGSPPDTIGVFVPEAPEAFGGMPGKTRLIRYCLCAKCQTKKDTPEKVEKIIRVELAGGVSNA